MTPLMWQIALNLVLLLLPVMAVMEWRAWRTADAVSTYPQAWTPRTRLIFRGLQWVTVLAAIVVCIATIFVYGQMRHQFLDHGLIEEHFARALVFSGLLVWIASQAARPKTLSEGDAITNAFASVVAVVVFTFFAFLGLANP